MPKAKHTRRSTHAVPATVDAALRKLQKFYETGIQVRQEFGMHAGYGKMRNAFPSLGAAETSRKARQLADPKGGYNRKEFDKLCSQSREHHFPIGTAAACYLLRVPKEQGQRACIQRELIENRWSNQQLLMEIHKRFGIRHRGAGKRGRLPQDTDEALVKLAKISGQWGRLCQVIGVREQEGGQKLPARSICLSKALRKRVCETDEAMRRMWNLVEGRTHK